MSAAPTLAYLRQHLPGFDSLRRAATWPGPLARWLVQRRLGPSARAADVVAALRLLREDDRSFCRAIRLDGWSEVADEESAVFRLADDGRLLWPVAVRALLLFCPFDVATEDLSGRLQPPKQEIDTVTHAGPHGFTVRTEAQPGGSFRVVLRR